MKNIEDEAVNKMKAQKPQGQKNLLFSNQSCARIFSSMQRLLSQAKIKKHTVCSIHFVKFKLGQGK